MNKDELDPCGISSGTKLLEISELKDKEALVVRGKSKYSNGIIIYMENKNIYMWHNNCPHANLNLDLIEGKIQSKDGYILCANHGAKFNPLDGKCFKGPCRGKKLKKFKFYKKDKYLIAE